LTKLIGQVNVNLTGELMEDKNENNELRLFAAEVIRKLWSAKDLSQLNLLKMQVESSIEDLEKKVDKGL
jgi:hypothetical protein